MNTATSMHSRCLFLIAALTLSPLTVSLPTTWGQTYQPTYQQTGQPTYQQTGQPTYQQTGQPTYQQAGHPYPQPPCDANPYGTRAPQACNTAPPGPACVKCPCPDCQRAAPRKADAPVEPRQAPPPPPEMRETGFYQAGPRTGALEGPSSSLGFRGGALTLPKIRLELPSIELPSLFRSSHTAKMRVSESEAPWTSTGFERVAVSGYDQQARSAPAQARSDDEPKSARSGDDDEADKLKREYEKKIEELNRKIIECEQLRKSIESSLRCQPPLPQLGYAPPAPACQAAPNAACTCPACRSYSAPHSHPSHQSGTQIRVIPHVPTATTTHPQQPVGPAQSPATSPQHPAQGMNGQNFEILETPNSRPPRVDSDDLPPPMPIPPFGPTSVTPSASRPFWGAEQTTKQASHVQPVIAPVQHITPAHPPAAMRPQRLPAF